MGYRAYTLKAHLTFSFIMLNKAVCCFIPCIEQVIFNRQKANSLVTANIKKIYLAHDYHKGYSSINCKQAKELLHVIRQLGASVIVEDPRALNDAKVPLHQLYVHWNRQDTPLKHFASLAHHCDVLATSVEYRIRTQHAHSQAFIADIVKTTHEQVKEMATWNDGPILNAEYKRYIKEYESILVPNSKRLFKKIEEQGSLGDVDYDALEYPQEANCILDYHDPFYKLQSCDKKQRVKDIITYFTRRPIDFKILHALVQHAKKGMHTTIVYAGSAHINRIKPVLEKLGYFFCRYARTNIDKDDVESPLNIAEAFQQLEPEYDPNMQLPKKVIDYLLAYLKFERDHPHMAAAIPTTVLLGILGTVYYWLATLLP